MALFKIYNNFSSRQAIGSGESASYHAGYCYLDVTTMKLWVDTTDTLTGRLALNAANADTATSATTASRFDSTRTIQLTGDVTGSDSKNGTDGWSITATLADSGVTAGSYGNSSNQTPGYGATFNVPYITVDSKGRVTSISDKTVQIPLSDNSNTLYMFENGTNCFKVTPSGSPTQTVTVTPSITNNVVSNGTTTKDYIVKFSGTNTVTDLVEIATSSTSRYLNENGSWATPPNDNTTYNFSGGTNCFKYTPSGGSEQTVTITQAVATATTLGSVIAAYNSSAARTIATQTSTAGRYYGVEVDSTGKMCVNVPWINYTHPTGAGNNHLPSGGSSGKWLKWNTDSTGQWTDLPTASTSGTGIVKLYNGTDSESTTLAATANAVRTVYNYAANLAAATADAMVFKGVLSGGESATTYTPAANCGDTYKVDVDGLINGLPCEIGDILICTTDNTAAASSGNYETVRENWVCVQNNVDRAVFTGENVLTNGKILVADGDYGKVKGENLKTTTVGSASAGTAISAYTTLTTGSSATVTAGSAASLSYTSRSIPNVTSVGTMTTVSYSNGIVTVTNGSAPTLGTAISADDITGWTTNTPTAVTAKTVVTGGSKTNIPNISVTSKQVVTGLGDNVPV